MLNEIIYPSLQKTKGKHTKASPECSWATIWWKVWFIVWRM